MWLPHPFAPFAKGLDPQLLAEWGSSILPALPGADNPFAACADALTSHDVSDTMYLMRNPATEMVHVRIDRRVKQRASKTLAAMGLSVSDAVRVLLTRVAVEKALPFEVKVPNAATTAAMQEARKGKLPCLQHRLRFDGRLECGRLSAPPPSTELQAREARSASRRWKPSPHP